MSRRLLVLWLSGIGLDNLDRVPSFHKLRKTGSVVGLEPLPITVPLVTHYQAFTGMNPGKFGVFDAVHPEGYEVIETKTPPPGVERKLLPRILQSGSIETYFEEVDPSLLASLAFDFSPSIRCCILKCHLIHSKFEHGKLDDVIRQAAVAMQDQGWPLFILSDFHPARVDKFVNINDFLAEKGIIQFHGEVRDLKDIDWQETLAYHIGHGQLWVNLRGREPQGIVQPGEEYEEVRDALARALTTKLTDPETGEPVVEWVYKKEELYSGDYFVKAPDLVITFKPGYIPSENSSRLCFDGSNVFEAKEVKLGHAGAFPSTVKGFLVASGEGIKKNYSGASAGLTDFAPTIIHLFGLSIPRAMDGEVIEDIFEPDFLRRNPIKREEESVLTAEEEELIKRRLRALGYLG